MCSIINMRNTPNARHHCQVIATFYVCTMFWFHTFDYFRVSCDYPAVQQFDYNTASPIWQRDIYLLLWSTNNYDFLCMWTIIYHRQTYEVSCILHEPHARQYYLTLLLLHSLIQEIFHTLAIQLCESNYVNRNTTVFFAAFCSYCVLFNRKMCHQPRGW